MAEQLEEPPLLQLDNAFWHFSLKVYATPGVAAECLALQRALSIDVNVLLFCAWLGAIKYIALDADAMASINDVVDSWHNTAVRPLRAVRENIKALPEMAHKHVIALREELVNSELRAEQIEQAILFGWAEALSAKESDHAPLDLMRGNIKDFLKRHSVDSGPTCLSYSSLLQAALHVACLTEDDAASEPVSGGRSQNRER